MKFTHKEEQKEALWKEFQDLVGNQTLMESLLMQPDALKYAKK